MTDDRDTPATKGDIQDSLTALETTLETRETVLETRIVERLTETIRDAQTELLKAFYGYADSNRKRVVQVEGNQGALIDRVGTLEDRITALERKVNFPEHPTQ